MSVNTKSSAILTAFVSLFLSACDTMPSIPQTVRVPVPVSCVKQAPERPQVTPTANLLAMDEYSATLTLFIERGELAVYAEKASAILESCR